MRLIAWLERRRFHHRDAVIELAGLAFEVELDRRMLRAIERDARRNLLVVACAEQERAAGHDESGLRAVLSRQPLAGVRHFHPTVRQVLVHIHCFAEVIHVAIPTGAAFREVIL